MKHLQLDLQLFADEGGDAGAPAEVTAGPADQSSAEGAETAEGADESASPDAQGAETEPTFEELVKGKYKADYQKAVQGAIQKRFRHQQDLKGTLDSMNPMLTALSQKYGLKAKEDGSIDLESLEKAVLDDDKLYEQEAFEKGIDVGTLKQMKQLERQNTLLRQQQEAATKEAQSRAEFDEILRQSEEVKQTYPSFDLSTEMNDPQFLRLIQNHVPVKTAYEVMHNDEILAGGMQYAVKQTAQKISNAVKAGQNRPTENGAASGAPASVGKKDPSKLTLKDFAEITARAERGERITFD